MSFVLRPRVRVSGQLQSASGRLPANPQERGCSMEKFEVFEDTCIVEARQLLAKPSFSREDSAKVDRFLRMAELTRSMNGTSGAQRRASQV